MPSDFAIPNIISTRSSIIAAAHFSPVSLVALVLRITWVKVRYSRKALSLEPEEFKLRSKESIILTR